MVNESVVDTVRESEVYNRLFEKMNNHLEEDPPNPDYERDQLHLDGSEKFPDVEVNEVRESEFEVTLVDRRDSDYRTIFKAEVVDGTVEFASLDIGQVVGPLAGSGYEVRYEEGDYMESRWIS